MESNYSSCKPAKPLVALEGETARASVLNYNLPTTTTFRVKNYITIDIPAEYWNEEALTEVVDSPHETLKQPPATQRNPASGKEVSVEGVLRGILDKPLIVRDPLNRPDPIDDPVQNWNADPANDPFAGNLNPVLVEMAATHPALSPLLALNQPGATPYLQFSGEVNPQSLNSAPGGFQPLARTLKTTSASTSLKQAESILGTNISTINLNAAYGKLPAFMRTLYGNFRTNFIKDPGRARPRLVLIEEYEVASYLGDYGAGKTLKTFSLLPGEKTTISIKTFRTTTENKSQTDNILDSFSQQSADTLEAMVNNEHSTSDADASAITAGFSSTESSQQQGSLSVSAGLNLGIISSKASVSGSLAHSSTDVNTGTSSSNRANTTNDLKKAMNNHVAQSEAARKTEVNTETQQSVSTTTGEETSTVREIQNINHSRVLNFVFRQLCQEYTTVTYLNDVSFGFTKGAIGDGRTAKLDNLEGLLRSVLKEEFVNTVKTNLIDELANVYDHNGTRWSFVQRVEEQFTSLVNPSLPEKTRVYFRRNADLHQTWDTTGKFVRGIILDVSTRILSTDAVIVEALLGQGEALDCYNQRLQDAAATRADLENAAKDQAINIIKGIEGATEQANLYKKVFGTDPQTIIKGIGNE